MTDCEKELLRTSYLLWRLFLDTMDQRQTASLLGEIDTHLDKVREWTVAKSTCNEVAPLVELLLEEDGVYAMMLRKSRSRKI